MPPKKRFIPQSPPAEQEPATIEYVTNLINQLRSEVASRGVYTKHADLHMPGSKDTINYAGTGTPGAGTGSGWPQMHTPTDLTIVSNGVTVTQDYHRISGSGTINDVHGAVANKLVMFTQVPWTGSALTVTWRDGAASDNHAASGNIRIHSTRYESSRFPATPYPLDNPSIVWNSNRYPGSNDSAAWSPIALGWLDNDGFFQLIDLTQAPMALLSESLQQGATTFDGGGISINAASSDGQAGSWMLAAPNASSLIIPITSDTIDRNFGGNYWTVAAQTGTADNLSNVTPLSNSFSNNTSGRMYSGDWVIISPDIGDTITIKNNTGTTGRKIFTDGGTDIVLDSTSKAVLLVGDKTLDTANGGWRCFSLAGASTPTAGFWPIMNSPTTITIAAGVLAITQDYHIVHGEGNANDTLDTISGGVANKWLVIKAVEGITISHDTGNIVLPGEQSYWIGGTQQFAMLYYNADISKWIAFVPDQGHLINDSTQSYFVRMETGTAITSGVPSYSPADFTISSDKLTAISHGIVAAIPETGTSDNLISLELLRADPGSVVILRASVDTDTITVKHNNASGTSGYKFFCQGGTDVSLGSGRYAFLVYNPQLDSAVGGWAVTSNADTISKSVVANVTMGSTAPATPQALVGPMLQGGTIISCKAKKVNNVAVTATAWIGDVQLVTAANSNTSNVGTTIFSTRPTIAVGSFYDAASVLSTTTFAAGDWFYFFSDQAAGGGGTAVVTLEVVYNR